jgi:hypothetical protein
VEGTFWAFRCAGGLNIRAPLLALRQRAFGDAEFFEGLDLVEQFERVGLPGEYLSFHPGADSAPGGCGDLSNP